MPTRIRLQPIAEPGFLLVMKMLMLLFLALTSVVLGAERNYLQNLPPEKFKAAGLHKLTAAELAVLQELFVNQNNVAVAAVKQEAETKVAEVKHEAEAKVAEVRHEAETKVAAIKQAAEVKVAEAKNEVAKQVEPAAAKGKPGWFGALLTLSRASAKPETAEPLVSHLVGDFRGWAGNTLFTLDDGTRWVQQNQVDKYQYSPVLHSPRVTVKPASMAGFWLEIEGVHQRLRVLPYSLEGK